MISVLSHRRLLSGNNLKLFIVSLSLLFLASCATTSKNTRVTKPVRTKPTTTTVKKNPNKVDTVEWTVLDSDQYKAITNENVSEINPLIKPINKISFLIPFEVKNDPSKLSRGEEKFSHYYAGVLLALEELESLGKRMSISVFDTGRSESKVKRLLQNVDIRQSDVIVGPYESNNLKTVAQWGKQNSIPIISPWRSSSNVTENNLFYYQMRPLIEQYFEAILKDAVNKHDPSEIFIINLEGKSDDARVRAIHKMHEAMNRGKIASPINEFEIVADSIQNSDYMMFDSLFMDHPNSAIIIPNYSSKDARYVYSLIRKINAEIQDQEIEIYGMPTLVNANRLDLEFFRSLDLNTVDFKHTDKSQFGVKRFIDRYFEKFGHIPNDDSFHGYDTMVMLANTSDYALNGNSETSNILPLLSMGVSFQRYHKNRLSGNSLQYKAGDFMVNSNLRLIEYHNNSFRAVPIR